MKKQKGISCLTAFLFVSTCLIYSSASGQISVTTTNASTCNHTKGSATITIDGGGGLQLEYSIDTNFQSSNTFTNLEAGNYVAIVRVKDGGCEFYKSFTIDEISGITVGISGTGTFNICDWAPAEAVLTASASGGSGDYNYSWPGQTITVRGSGNFSVTVTDRKTGCTQSAEGEVIFIQANCAVDPNDITGPMGYGPKKMIAKSEEHAYLVRFENDPTFATASAQVVTIRQPLDKTVNIFSLRLADFGFAGSTFHVPPNSTFYKGTLDLAGSLGVTVDVTAGVDAVRREVLWIFESKDPNTGLAPTNASLGFLPINDSTSKGEGFVGFTIKAADAAQTGDTIHAKADIVFDVNPAIPTPEIENIVDAVAPTSQLSLVSLTQNIISLAWTAQDDPGGSGVKDYALYVSKDGGPFQFYQRFVGNSTNFTGMPGSSYCFYVLASDNVNNQESPPINNCQLSVNLTGTALPLTWLYFKGQEKGSDVALSWATGTETNTDYFVVERSGNGQSFQETGRVMAVGNSTLTHNYLFIDQKALILYGPKIYYRLRQIDKDGHFTYSSIVLVTVRNQGDLVITVYPNPFSKNLTLLISTLKKPGAGDFMELYSLNGTLLYKQNLSMRQNNIPIFLNKLPELAAGTYILHTNLNGTDNAMKITKQ